MFSSTTINYIRIDHFYIIKSAEKVKLQSIIPPFFNKNIFKLSIFKLPIHIYLNLQFNFKIGPFFTKISQVTINLVCNYKLIIFIITLNVFIGMIELQNIVLQIVNAFNSKQDQANLQWETQFQHQIQIKPTQRLEEIYKSASDEITNKNDQALEQFANFFHNTYDKLAEIPEYQSRVQANKQLNLQKIQNKQCQGIIKQQDSYQFQNQLDTQMLQKEKNVNKAAQKLTKSQSIEKNGTKYFLNKKIQNQEVDDKVNRTLEGTKNNNQAQNNQGIKEIIKNPIQEVQVSKFQKYKNQLKNYQQLDRKDIKSHDNQNGHNINETIQRKNQKNNTQNSSQARNIVQELQQMRKRQKEKERLIVKKSQLNKPKIGRIFKMNPQIQKKNQQLRKNQAEEKLKANIAFLDSIKNKGSTQFSPSYKQFNNFNYKQEKDLGGSLRIQNKKRLQKLGFSDRSRMKISSTNVVALFPQPSWNFLPPIQKNNGMRPKPYSIYHVNQKSNEIFYNKLQKAQ